jgi:hypothetical protein
MPANATEKWSERSLVRSIDGWQASRTWQVVGAVDESQAMDAQPLNGNDPIARLNESHPQNGALKVRSVSVRRAGHGVYEVGATYGTPPIGSDTWTTQDKVLTQAPRATIRPGLMALPTDRDLRGRPIVNAAGDALNPPQMRNVRVKYLTVTRYEPYWDYLRLAEFEQAWNTVDLRSGNVIFPAGDVLCESIHPAEEIELTERTGSTANLKMQYNFVIFTDFTVDASGNRRRIPFPWATYLQNLGHRGWYSDPDSGKSQLGDLYYKANGRQITDDVPLDRQGRPINESYKVSPDGDTFYTPVANPNDLNLAVADLGQSGVVYLRFDLLHATDLTQLRL